MREYYSLKKYFCIFTVEEMREHFPSVNTTHASKDQSYLVIVNPDDLQGRKEIIGPFPSSQANDFVQERMNLEKEAYEMALKNFHLLQDEPDEITKDIHNKLLNKLRKPKKESE